MYSIDRAWAEAVFIGYVKSSLRIKFKLSLASILAFSAVSWASLFLHQTGLCFMINVLSSSTPLSFSFMLHSCHMIFVSLAGD